MEGHLRRTYGCLMQRCTCTIDSRYNLQAGRSEGAFTLARACFNAQRWNRAQAWVDRSSLSARANGDAHTRDGRGTGRTSGVAGVVESVKARAEGAVPTEPAARPNRGKCRRRGAGGPGREHRRG